MKKLTHDEILKAKQSFSKLIKTHKKQRKRKRNLLGELQSNLTEAREEGFSYLEISSFLKDVGIEISADSVRRFCQEVIGEKPLKRRRKKTKKV